MIKHPYFTFSNAALFDDQIFQWQVHPVMDGPNRYTLVSAQNPKKAAATPPENGDGSPTEHPERDSEIKAIYNHIGLSSTVSQGISEGFLLLPAGTSKDNEEWEDVMVSSLLTVLRTIRNISPEPGKPKKKVRIVEDESLKKSKTKDEEVTTPKAKEKRGFFSRAFGKSK